MATDTVSTELVKPDQIQNLVITTNEALALNKTSAEKASEAGLKLIASIEQSGMTEEMDQKCNDFLVKIRKTKDAMEARRKPTTQLFDQLKKVFTSLENQIDSKGDLYSRIQGFRDAFAKEKAEEARRKEEEAKRKLEIEKEKSEVTQKIEAGIASHFNTYLTKTKSDLLEKFNHLTLLNFEKESLEISSYPSKYPKEHFDQFGLAVTTIYLTIDDKKTIKGSVLASKYEQYDRIFTSEVTELKNDLFAKLGSKKSELEAIAEAEKKNAEEASRLKAEQAERERQEKERLAREAKERETKAQEEAQSHKQEADMNSLFEAAAETAGTGPTAALRKSLKIVVKNPAAYVQIFQLWFEREGMKLSTDEIEKKSIGQMKAFCEKLATKDGETISSKYISYEEDLKTLAKSR